MSATMAFFHSFNQNLSSIQISLKLFPKGPVEKKACTDFGYGPESHMDQK